MDYAEYRRHDATGLARLVADGEVSAAELLDVAIARAEAVDPALNAIVQPMHEQARRRASADLSGPFAGVPFLVKDLFQDVAGLRTGSGSRATTNHRAATNSTVVQQWIDAGLVIFGKTNTPEFGTKGVTEPEANGPTRNPWDVTRTSGGSSGGSAASVAAGVVPMAGASDGGGSIRIPAAWCGLVGLKPGRGVVSSGPNYAEYIHGSATEGVVSRTVRDSAAMLDVLTATHDLSGPFLPARPDESYAELARREPGRLRIGFVTASPIDTAVDPEAVAAVEGAARLLESLGHDVFPTALDIDGQQMAQDFMATWSAEVAVTVRNLRAQGADRGDFELDTLLLAAVGSAMTAPDLTAAHQRWHTYARALADFHAGADLLLTPSVARPPVRIGELDTPPALRAASSLLLRSGLAGQLHRTKQWKDTIVSNLAPVPFTQLANITGRPAMSLPLHRTAEGLPLGVQLTGGLGSEPMLLSL
ncbi:MAG TPA: amidase family protein, partial [Acidimicrobiales bacterium]